jgi:hypothetical protein
VGFGVLLVTVDAADTATTGVAAGSSSSAPSGSEPPSSSTTSAAVGSVTPTQPTPSTTMRAAPSTTQRPTTTTTTTTTTAEPPGSGTITFDLRCIGIGLESDSSITFPADGPEVLQLIEFWVVERIVAVIGLSEDDRSDLDGLVADLDLDLRRCADVLANLQDDEQDLASGSGDSSGKAWLCAFATEVVESDELVGWLNERGVCLEERDAATTTTTTDGDENEDTVVGRPTSTPSVAAQLALFEREQ